MCFPMDKSSCSIWFTYEGKPIIHALYGIIILIHNGLVILIVEIGMFPSAPKILEIKDAKGLPPMWYALEFLQEQSVNNTMDCVEIAPDYYALELLRGGASRNTVS